MKVAIIGSRNLTVNNIGDYLSPNVDEIISGGAKGIDACAREYALANNIKLTELLPEYGKYGKAAPIVRNREIVNAADCVLAFWNGKSRGTKYTIDYAQNTGKPVFVTELFDNSKNIRDKQE